MVLFIVLDLLFTISTNDLMIMITMMQKKKKLNYKNQSEILQLILFQGFLS